MFEKEAEEYAGKVHRYKDNLKELLQDEDVFNAFKDGAEFGYNKAKEESMLKLKDEGIVKLLKDSIIRNERLSSQEQQELCAWIECAMDFGENLDECAKELEELHKATEWHFVKDGDLPKEEKEYLVYKIDGYGCKSIQVMQFNNRHCWCANCQNEIIAWKEIVLPKESE